MKNISAGLFMAILTVGLSSASPAKTRRPT